MSMSFRNVGKTQPVPCSMCGETTCYLSPGEAARLPRRSAVFCGRCRDLPLPLTERQQEALDVATRLREATGKAPTLVTIADAMQPPVTPTRVKALLTVVKARGHGDLVDAALHGGRPATTATPVQQTATDALLSPLDGLAAVAEPAATAAQVTASWEGVRY